MKSSSVKKLIYTASVVAASPLKEDGSGYKDSMDDSCWTPLNLSYDQMLSVRSLSYLIPLPEFVITYPRNLIM